MVNTTGKRNLLAHLAVRAGLGSLLLTIQPLLADLGSLAPQSSAFSYHGFLTDQGGPATGIYDLRFTIYDAASGGTAASAPVTAADLGVTNGLFNVTLDFGATAFDGSDRWLEIAVRPGASTSDFTTVVPRQKITATPYAIRAANYSGPINASQITGQLAASSIPAGMITSDKLAAGAVMANLTAADAGGLVLDGCRVTNLNASSLASGTIPAERFPAVLPAIDGSQLTNISGRGISPTNTPVARDMIEATSGTTFRSVPGSVKLNATNGQAFGLTLTRASSGPGPMLRFVPSETNAASGNACWTWQQSIANNNANSEIIYSQSFNYENGRVVDTNRHAWMEVWELNWDPFEPSDTRQLEHYRVFVDRSTGEFHRYQGEVLRDGDIEQNTYGRYIWWANDGKINQPAVTMILDDADSGNDDAKSSAVVGINGVLNLTGTKYRGPAKISLSASAAHDYAPYILISNAQATKSLTIAGGGEGYGLAGQALIWAEQDVLRIMAAQQILMSTNVAVLGNVSGSNFIGNGAQLSGTASAAGGLVLKSNSWLSIPALQEGDVWLGSSNGILHSISLVGGIYTTNRLAP
jgi:hypothetical protein